MSDLIKLMEITLYKKWRNTPPTPQTQQYFKKNTWSGKEVSF